MMRNQSNYTDCNLSCGPVNPHCGTAETESLRHLVTMDYDYRTMDGSLNNKKNTSYGLKDQTFIRKVNSVYNQNDGCTLNDLNGTRPNPRDVSNCVLDQEEPCPNTFCLSNVFWLWGQFIAHTFTLAEVTDECVNIPVTDEEDPLYDEIPFKRSESDPDNEECSPRNPREQVNSLTPWLDASSVYGCDEERSEYIREFCGGRLKMDCNGLAPLNDSTMDNSGKYRGPNFVFGDIRGNENLGLASLHTVFVREHNYWAHQICEICPNMSDEEIYQRAKIMVEAELQAITYNEFLPLLLGECFPSYMYDEESNPQPTNVFSGAAYRLHSMIPTDIACDIKIRDIFFASKDLLDCTTNVGAVLSNFACGISEELDQKIVDDLRNLLFGEPGMGGMDIGALDIQRGRDHGLGSINDYLACFELDPLETFADITTDTALQAKLAQLYAKPEDIDIWVYMQIKSGETNDSVLEPLAKAIIKDSFMRLRDGDRLWYENRLSSSQICTVNNTRLSDIIRRNICECDVPDNVFVVKPWKIAQYKQDDCEDKSCANPCVNPCEPCFDSCQFCASDPCRCKPESLIYKCAYCKCNPCVCIIMCDDCGCNPCRCEKKFNCKPESTIYKQCEENSMFLKHSKYSGYNNNGCFKFPNEKRVKCTSDISDLDEKCRCYQPVCKCRSTYSKPGCKPCRPHDRPKHCKPCKQVYVVTCKCRPRCNTRCQDPIREIQYIE